VPANTIIQVRRDTAANWVTAQTAAGATPLLAAGEIGFETDTGRFKAGNGTALWGALPYFLPSDRVNVNTGLKTGAYTLATGDYGTVVQMDGAFAFTVGTGLYNAPVGTQIMLLARTTGVTVVATGTNVVVNATPGLKLRAAWSAATLICLSSSASACTWVLTGDLSA
jgi:hypothetical protein